MKKVLYIVLAVALLYLVFAITKDKSLDNTSSQAIVEESVDVIEENPDDTGMDLETVVSE